MVAVTVSNVQLPVSAVPVPNTVSPLLSTISPPSGSSSTPSSLNDHMLLLDSIVVCCAASSMLPVVPLLGNGAPPASIITLPPTPSSLQFAPLMYTGIPVSNPLCITTIPVSGSISTNCVSSPKWYCIGFPAAYSSSKFAFTLSNAVRNGSPFLALAAVPVLICCLVIMLSLQQFVLLRLRRSLYLLTLYQ